MIFVCLCLITSPSVIISGSIPVAAVALVHSSYGSIVFHYMHHIFFIHSSVDGHLGCFHALSVVDGAAVNVGVHASFQIRVFFFSRYMPKTGIVGLYGSSILVS